MTDTPQQPTTALTDDEQKTVRSAAISAYLDLPNGFVSSRIWR